MDEARAPAPALSELLAGELDGVQRTLEGLALQLCLDPVVFERHAAVLQQFDLLTQTIGEVARVMRSCDPQSEGVAAIRLQGMQDRLTGVQR